MTEPRSTLKQKIYRIIKIGYTGDMASRLFDIVIAVSILLNLFIIFFETFESSKRYIGILSVIELITVIIFTVEYILRILVADLAYPAKKTYAAAVAAFVFSLYGLIDLFSFAPYWLSFAFPTAAIPAGTVAFRMLRVVRILRLFRINRYYDAFNVITDVIKEKKNQILSALFIILMLVMGASIIMYNLEHAAQPEAFKNAFSGIWWSVSTLLTVGYGDIYPVTAAGRAVGIVLAFLGVGIVAIPTGIISAGFVQQYTKIRDLAGISDEYPLGFMTITIDKDHEWTGVKVCDINLVKGAVILAVLRDNEMLVPDGELVISDHDRVIVGSLDMTENNMSVEEVIVGPKSEWIDANASEFAASLNAVCVLVKRGDSLIVPDNRTVVKGDDAVIVARRNHGGKME
ncbi:MAG: ion transporter [Lachnospiraceae bacterium]|nr:ion transporter [Lachnospiraceae bacterium]